MTNIFERNSDANISHMNEDEIHVYGNRIVCKTDSRGHATPENKSPLELIVNAPGGYIPLWDQNVTLRYRFQPRTLNTYRYPEEVKKAVRDLIGEALQLWGRAVPVRFKEANEAWDFEIVLQGADECSPQGCVLASAFFPDRGQHELTIYPKMLDQPRQEQIETIAHELGHVFGLRHFFAQISENRWPSEIFGDHQAFSIMNYGDPSIMTDADRNDLERLYSAAWTGILTNINGTPIKLVRPFSSDRP